MRRTLLSFIIFTCLSAVWCADAQETEEDAERWMFQAAAWERVYYDSEDPSEANQALMEKAGCYKQSGHYKAAVATLERIRLYACTPEERHSITIEKALCSYLDSDYDAAMAFLTEAGVAVDEEQPRLKSEWATMLLTLLVPAGYVYVGEPGEGLISTALNAGSVAWTVCNIASGHCISGILGGAIALYTTYMGAQQRTASLVQEKNAAVLTEAKRSAVYTALAGCLGDNQ